MELIEVLEQADQGRAAAFHSRSELRRREKRSMLEALIRTRAILDDAGCPIRSSAYSGRESA
ncbi:hypothetical protein [Trinickia sp.]|uniref:hypothetical protein n=1 Tax=Trinickia sp. TaxID=2571163 RepID=UPI003F80F5DE